MIRNDFTFGNHKITLHHQNSLKYSTNPEYLKGYIELNIMHLLFNSRMSHNKNLKYFLNKIDYNFFFVVH